MNVDQLRKALDLISALDNHLANFADIQDYENLRQRYIKPLKRVVESRLYRAESELLEKGR